MNKQDIVFENIDCFVKMKSMKDNMVDLIVTDPPYGISFNGFTSNTTWDKMDDNEYYDLLLRFLSEVKRILKEDGTLWMFCARTKIPLVFKAINEVELKCNLENWLTYVRAKGRGAKNKLKSQCEEVLHITKNDKYYWNGIEYLREVIVPYVKDGKPRGWFLDQNTGQRLRWSGVGNALLFTSPFYKNKLEPQIHSTQKPFLLFTELIMLSSKQGDLVFDPFAGSACSAISACATNRKYIGCEIDIEMYNKAKNWIDTFNEDLIDEYIQSRIRNIIK